MGLLFVYPFFMVDVTFHDVCDDIMLGMSHLSRKQCGPCYFESCILWNLSPD